MCCTRNCLSKEFCMCHLLIKSCHLAYIVFNISIGTFQTNLFAKKIRFENIDSIKFYKISLLIPQFVF